MREVWKYIATFPGYEASSQGRIRFDGTIITGSYSKEGYHRFCLKRGLLRIWTTGHVLVCTAFNGKKPSPKHEVCHIDGSKDNNVPENLRWGTRKENVADKMNHGTDTRGQRNPLAKLTDKQVINMRREYKDGVSATKLAKKYGIGRSNAFEIVAGRRWAHLLPDETSNG